MRSIMLLFLKSFWLFFFISCSSNDSSLHLNAIGGKIVNFDPIGWEIVYERETDQDLEYRFIKDKENQYEKIHFIFHKQVKSYEIIDYKIEYFVNETKYYIEMKYDTLMHYRINNATKNKEYLRGKYYSDFKKGNLLRGQSEYFISHFDSLIRIKGDSLVALPRPR